jgi:hypothetical protein
VPMLAKLPLRVAVHTSAPTCHLQLIHFQVAAEPTLAVWLGSTLHCGPTCTGEAATACHSPTKQHGTMQLPTRPFRQGLFPGIIVYGKHTRDGTGKAPFNRSHSSLK